VAKLRDRQDNVFAMYGVWRRAIAVMLAMKDKGFGEECEWRMVLALDDRNPVRFRSGRFGVTPYCALPLCAPGWQIRLEEVWLGPNTGTETAYASLRSLLGCHLKLFTRNTGTIKVSDVPYRY
jgi:hypothetical protein